MKLPIRPSSVTATITVYDHTMSTDLELRAVRAREAVRWLRQMADAIEESL